MAKKIKGKPSLDSLILSGDKIKKINLYLKEYLTTKIKLKYLSAIFNYVNIKREELDNLLDLCNKYRKAILDEGNEIEIPRKKDALISMILNGHEIEKIETSDVRLDSIVVIHFKDNGHFIYKHMSPSNLGRYMRAYWKIQRMNAGKDEPIDTIFVNKGSEEKLFQNYKKEVINSFCEFLGLPNNYSNKNKN